MLLSPTQVCPGLTTDRSRAALAPQAREQESNSIAGVAAARGQRAGDEPARRLWAAWAGRSGPPRAGAGRRRAVRLCTQGRLQEEGGNKWCQTRTSTRVLRVLLIGSLIPQHTKGWHLLFVMQLGGAPMLGASRHHYMTSTALTKALGAIGSVAACLDLRHTHCSAGW